MKKRLVCLLAIGAMLLSGCGMKGNITVNSDGTYTSTSLMYLTEEEIAQLSSPEYGGSDAYSKDKVVDVIEVNGVKYYGFADEDSASSANDAFTDSVSYITSLIQQEYAYESLNEEQEKELFDGLSPLLSRKVGVWVGSTDELLRYDNYMPYTLSMMQLPGYNEDEYTPPLLISYPLCISESCENPDEVSAFASFIALDEDALLLTSRLQPREGFLPSVSQPAVWKSVTDRQKYGIYLSLYRDMMYQAIYIPAVSESENFASDMKYVTSHMEALFNLEEDD